jgi:hypothetical protein
MHNSNYNRSRRLSEGLEFRDLEGMIKPSIHVDEFSSKMGDDEDIIVISFFVRSKRAARDLMSWFEKGYDFVVDADCSPGELKPNRYLVYVELRRRSAAPRLINELLDDLSTLTEFELKDWVMHYDGRYMPWSEQVFSEIVPLTPDAYRRERETDLNEWREAAGLPTKRIHCVKPDIRDLQDAAGIDFYKGETS